MERERAGSAWSAVVEVFGRRQLRAAELAFAWAHLGEWAFTVALAVVAFRDGGASGVGLVAVVRMVPSAIGTPVIIAVADRARRDRVLVVVSAVRVVTIGGAALALALGGHRVVFYGLVVVASVVFTAFRPVHSSLLPLLCTTTAELMNANVVRGLLASIATLLGPLLAAGLLAWAGAATVFATAAGLSLLAATSLLRVPSDVDGTVEPVERVQLVQGTLRGLKALRSEPDVRRMFGLGFAQTYTRGALNVFAVVIAFDLLDIGESGVATLTAAVGLGGVVGSAVASLMVGSRRLGAWLVIALALWGTPIAMIGAVPETFAAFALLGVVGVANSIIDVPLFTLPVRLVPDDVLAPLFGVFESMIAIGVALGSAMTPAAIGILGVRGAMIASGLLLPLVGLIAWPRLRALDARLEVRDAEIQVLRANPMLRLLPVPSIEYLASRTSTRRVPEGALICKQGDQGDSYFVIAAGTAEVIGGGATLGILGPGDGFGEIALLRDIPRTASVRAGSDLVVMEIGRDTFLEVVSGHSRAGGAAEAVVAAHLANLQPAAVGI